MIDRETRRLDHLLENVLQFSRTERQQVQLDPRRQSLLPLVDEVRQSFAPIAEARKVVLRVEVDGEVDVNVDAESYQRVLLNLLDNAVKYGPAGQTVSVSVLRDGDVVRTTVDDQGDGIAPENAGKIWEKYWRAHSAEKSAVAGTGIGLAVVRELVLRQGGAVEVGSASGGGARFVVELPAAPAQPKAPGDPAEVGRA